MLALASPVPLTVTVRLPVVVENPSLGLVMTGATGSTYRWTTVEAVLVWLLKVWVALSEWAPMARLSEADQLPEASTVDVATVMLPSRTAMLAPANPVPLTVKLPLVVENPSLGLVMTGAAGTTFRWTVLEAALVRLLKV